MPLDLIRFDQTALILSELNLIWIYLNWIQVE